MPVNIADCRITAPQSVVDFRVPGFNAGPGRRSTTLADPPDASSPLSTNGCADTHGTSRIPNKTYK